ncbi:(R)-mandelonitrile beta-glucosyltransferase-like [Pyrus communis]|uniref:(R)-mandelonitrile beta-glucosyltransferase-like n=1 Tax=Pyrus communis TaxID=23211 RepID=UPI0035C00D75
MHKYDARVFLRVEIGRYHRASSFILNTFYAFEHEVLDALSTLLPPIYSVGPLHLQLNQIPAESELKSIGSNLWTEEPECLEWLDSKEPNSVVYVNFGSITVMTEEQLTEFAWGLANSNQTFLWVVRPDLVGGESAVVPSEFSEETKERSLVASWCLQQEALSHPAIGGFSCKEWGIGMEIEGDVKRDYIEGLVRKLMEGEEGKEKRKKALERKKLATEATTSPNGMSFVDLDRMASQVLQSPVN